MAHGHPHLCVPTDEHSPASALPTRIDPRCRDAPRRHPHHLLRHHGPRCSPLPTPARRGPRAAADELSLELEKPQAPCGTLRLGMCHGPATSFWKSPPGRRWRSLTHPTPSFPHRHPHSPRSPGTIPVLPSGDSTRAPPRHRPPGLGDRGQYRAGEGELGEHPWVPPPGTARGSGGDPLGVLGPRRDAGRARGSATLPVPGGSPRWERREHSLAAAARRSRAPGSPSAGPDLGTGALSDPTRLPSALWGPSGAVPREQLPAAGTGSTRAPRPPAGCPAPERPGLQDNSSAGTPGAGRAAGTPRGDRVRAVDSAACSQPGEAPSPTSKPPPGRVLALNIPPAASPSDWGPPAGVSQGKEGGQKALPSKGTGVKPWGGAAQAGNPPAVLGVCAQAGQHSAAELAARSHEMAAGAHTCAPRLCRVSAGARGPCPAPPQPPGTTQPRPRCCRARRAPGAQPGTALVPEGDKGHSHPRGSQVSACPGDQMCLSRTLTPVPDKGGQ